MRHEPTLRPARTDDAARIHEIHTASVRVSCAPHYAPEVIDGWLSGRSPDGYIPSIDRGEMFVATLDDEVVGFGHAVSGEVVAVFVDPLVARQGVGRLIMSRALEVARTDHNGPVRVESTLNAVGFYETLGFHEVARSSVRRGSIYVQVAEMQLDA